MSKSTLDSSGASPRASAAATTHPARPSRAHHRPRKTKPAESSHAQSTEAVHRAAQADAVVPALEALTKRVSEMPQDAIARRRTILESLCTVFDSQAAMFFAFGDALLGGQNPAEHVLIVGLDEPKRAPVEQYLKTGTPPDPAISAMMTRTGHFLTLRREQLVNDSEWYASEHYQRISKPADLDDHLISRIWLPQPGICFAITLHRATARPRYTHDDALRLNLFNRDAWHLYQLNEKPADPRITALPPRLRPVLTHLLAGDAQKQVAYKLGLSKHTIHQYTKALYKQLNVNSRGELLAQFVGKV